MSDEPATVDIEMNYKPGARTAGGARSKPATIKSESFGGGTSMSWTSFFSTGTFFFAMAICAITINTLVRVNETRVVVREPPLPGVLPGVRRPRIVLAQDVDWPPYAYVSTPPEGDYDVAGFGHDVAKGLESVCDIEVVTRQTDWSECWGDNKVGTGLDNGVFHGCMTYTHTAGTRGRYMDFSHGILSANKPAGILTRLGSDGKPIIDPTSDLSGMRIVDVKGWAPTADGLALVTNWCTGSRFTGYTLLTPAEAGNDAAMRMLRSGEADGMFVYADQAYNYRPGQPGVTATWDEHLWSGLGTKFAYISTGMLGHAYNGTTLAISKKGSGLNAILNPCIEKFMATPAYYETCQKHELTDSCYVNAHFPAVVNATAQPWAKRTNEHLAGGCASGYCECTAGVTSGTDDLIDYGSGP